MAGYSEGTKVVSTEKGNGNIGGFVYGILFLVKGDITINRDSICGLDSVGAGFLYNDAIG